MIRKKMAGAVLAAVVTASLVFSGCGANIDPATTVATIGDTKVSYGLANFWLRMQQANYDVYYRQYFGDKMWDDKSSTESDKTMGESLKQTVLDGFKQFYVLDEHKADYNIEITEEEMAKIKSVAKSFMEKNSAAVSKGYAVTREEDVAEALRLLTVESKVSKAIKSGVDKNVSDEEAAQRTFTYIRFNIKNKTGDNGAVVDLTEDEIKTVREKASKMYEAVKAGGNVDDLAKENDAMVSTYSYGKNDEGMAKAVLEAADKLKEGEFSDIIENEGFLYIVRLDKEHDAEATENKKQSIITQRENELFESVTKPWLEAKEMKIDEAVWSKVKFERTMSMAAPSSSAAQK